MGRRRRQGSWLYILCLMLYLLYALFLAEEVTHHTGASLSALWYLTLPLVVIVAQLVYPTVLGWGCVLTGFTVYLVIGTYYLIRNFGWSQWRVDTSGFVGGLILLAVLLGICKGLYSYRPMNESDGDMSDT
jgi:hypothetical protein